MRYDYLPAEFADIASRVNYVHRKSHNEYSGSCPQCGGEVHKGGDAPDRFVMFVIGRYGFPLGFCRRCGYRWTAKGKQPDMEDVQIWRERQIEVEKARLESAKRSLDLLQNDKIWEMFFEQNNDYSMDVFRGWGLSDSWIKYLKLGLVPDYTLKYKEVEEWKEYHTPAFSIPIWYTGAVVQQIKLRLANPREKNDRYRNLYPMGKSFLYVPLYDLPLEGAGVIVEGEKKAAVVEQTLDDLKYRVVGLQSKTPDSSLFAQMEGLDPIYLGLDPDAFIPEFNAKGERLETSVEYCTRLLGRERVRIVEFPCKPDDGILAGMNPMAYIRMARKPIQVS